MLHFKTFTICSALVLASVVCWNTEHGNVLINYHREISDAVPPMEHKEKYTVIYYAGERNPSEDQ